MFITRKKYTHSEIKTIYPRTIAKCFEWLSENHQKEEAVWVIANKTYFNGLFWQKRRNPQKPHKRIVENSLRNKRPIILKNQ